MRHQKEDCARIDRCLFAIMLVALPVKGLLDIGVVDVLIDMHKWIS